MKRFVLVFLLLQFVLVQLAGCSIAPYPTGDISKNPSLAHFDMNNLPFAVKIEHQQDEGKKIMRAIPKYELGANKTFSIKYHRSLIYSAPNVNIFVEFPNGRKYAAYLDTGGPGVALLTSDIVLDNRYAIMPVDSNSNVGICHIPELNIGSARIRDVMGYYEKQQWQLRILNIPVYKHSAVILGRSFIKSFDYVLFDNVKKEAVFSKEGAFKPDNPQVWTSYPFTEEPNPGDTIMVKLPIAGQVFDVAFDSCGGKPGLELNKNCWNTIKPKLSVKRLRKSHYYRWQAGRISCQKATVSEISVGEKIIKNADITIDDVPDNLSILGLGYFQDTVVVLDYVNKLMWIKK